MLLISLILNLLFGMVSFLPESFDFVGHDHYVLNKVVVNIVMLIQVPWQIEYFFPSIVWCFFCRYIWLLEILRLALEGIILILFDNLARHSRSHINLLTLWDQCLSQISYEVPFGSILGRRLVLNYTECHRIHIV